MSHLWKSMKITQVVHIRYRWLINWTSCIKESEISNALMNRSGRHTYTWFPTFNGYDKQCSCIYRLINLIGNVFIMILLPAQVSQCMAIKGVQIINVLINASLYAIARTFITTVLPCLIDHLRIMFAILWLVTKKVLVQFQLCMEDQAQTDVLAS